MTLIEIFRCTFHRSVPQVQLQSLFARGIASLAATLTVLLLVTSNAAAGTDVVWVEDATPAGAGLGGRVESWTWISANPAPYSGSTAHQSVIAAGLHQHYFQNAPAAVQLPVATGDALFAYVYLDPANLPSQIMLEWRTGTSWEQRAYWGANTITFGTNGTNSRRYMGPLPAAGQWVRLEVPASQVGLEGQTLNGMAFTLFDGRATWDRAGKVAASGSNAPPVVSLTSPANNSTYTAPASITLNATATDSDGISKVEFYNGATLLGSDTTAPYSWPLTNVAAGSYSYTAKAYDSLNALATSEPVTATVNAANTPPTVSLTAPVNGSTYTAPAAITLNATASDSNGISKVEFYSGATLLGTDTTAPYSWSLSNVAAGSYSYTAKAYDSLNASTTSSAVNVTVNAPNTPPSVSLTSPATGSTYTTPAAITLNATASDSDGIAKVEFYSGATLLGTDTTSPYSWSLSNVAAGSYSYTARAYDSLNASTTSSAVNVTVNAAPVRTETVTYYHNDALGSPVAATDASGNLVWRETYRPYGERLNNQAASSSNPIWYTGKRQDAETGLVYMGSRYYDPRLGRFLSIDPVEPDENNLHSLNRYAYANNNPYKFTDPDGQNPFLILVAFGMEMINLANSDGPPGGGLAGTGTKTAGKLATKGEEITQTVKQVADRGAAKAGEKAATTNTVTVSKSRFPESAKHIEDAVAAGKPNTLTIDRASAASRRRDSLRGTESKPGLDRDEFPPAMFREGGQGSSVRHINRSDNRGAGACVGSQCRGLADGTKVRIEVVK